MTQAEAHAQGHDDHAGDSGGHEDHPDFLAHHWQAPKQQFEAGKLGMWLFVATEVLLFGGLFCAYAWLRSNQPELFEYGSQYLNRTMGAINTCVLILSSLTMALAVTAAQRGKMPQLKIYLALTLLGAFGFLVIKYFEYSHKFHNGIYPGAAYYSGPADPAHADLWKEDAWTDGKWGEQPPPDLAPAPQEANPDEEPDAVTPGQIATGSNIALAPVGPGGLVDDAETFLIERGLPDAEDQVLHHLQDANRPPNAHLFFNIYFMATGLHGIHVVVGVIVITWLLVKTMRGRFSKDYFTPIDLGGLYWHVVDLIWIFLFPLFYLI